MLLALALSFIFLVWLVFDKLRLVPLTLPVAIILGAVAPMFVAVLLFSMAQYHPAAKHVMVLRRVIEIRPLISVPGQVIEIAIRPNRPIKKDDVLFKIDPAPFESEVKRQQAALAAAEQNVRQLATRVNQTAASTQKAQQQASLAQSEYDRQVGLLSRNVTAQATVDKYLTALNTAKEALKEARAVEEAARLAYQSTIGGVNTTVAQVREQLRQAEANLSDATVLAPCDGFATNMQLLPGSVVSSAAAVATFVCDGGAATEHGVVLASFTEGSYRNIHVGDYAEVVFKMYPGQVFTGRVQHTIDVTNEGQLRVTGLVPDLKVAAPTVFAVVIRLDNAETLRLPGGAQGGAAVLTGTMQPAGVFRMALLRAQTWLSYVL
jgi:multidrug resistance efflux pump